MTDDAREEVRDFLNEIYDSIFVTPFSEVASSLSFSIGAVRDPFDVEWVIRELQRFTKNVIPR
jgi:hypothetical protein